MKETETLELKKSTSELKEAIISIVAILNKHRGENFILGLGKMEKLLDKWLPRKLSEIFLKQ